MSEYRNAVQRSRLSSQESVVAVMEAEAANEVDGVKCFFESCILNINLTNVNTFFIVDKRGKYISK
jgi:hypothetical protein